MSAEELEARSKGRTKKEESYQKKRAQNDQAYFVFMFSRLEGRIKTGSDALIDEQYARPLKGAQKRAWDILYKRKNENPDSIKFMDRAGLLTPMSGGDFALVKAYYKERNSIAHGGSFTITISMPTAISNLKHLYSAVRH